MRNILERAVAAVLRAVAVVAMIPNEAVVLIATRTRPWASITFAGARHVMTIRIVALDEAALDRAIERLVTMLPDAEIPLSGEMVADLTIAVEGRGPDDGGWSAALAIEMLTVRE
jgi:hypothetical protein